MSGLDDMSTDFDEIAPKVRKPYTITKPRERWTDEEHTRFLEAVQKYGRAWRSIEEHVGTKTAVQIRSHAQKFFSKMLKDPCADSCAGAAIDIPPPRPKKKPTRPYPRKMPCSSNSAEVTQVQKLPLRSYPEYADVIKEEAGSPTSVLSTGASENSGSIVFNTPEKSRSTVTGITQSLTDTLSFQNVGWISTSMGAKDPAEESGNAIRLFGKMMALHEQPFPDGDASRSSWWSAYDSPVTTPELWSCESPLEHDEECTRLCL